MINILNSLGIFMMPFFFVVISFLYEFLLR
nr:MAG TPA: hypothetical protein [Caudoviricetes sp.]DAW54310.1 MAG TPA: hypothetical protein [Caudoviricetes sp.]